MGKFYTSGECYLIFATPWLNLKAEICASCPKGSGFRYQESHSVALLKPLFYHNLSVFKGPTDWLSWYRKAMPSVGDLKFPLCGIVEFGKIRYF